MACNRPADPAVLLLVQMLLKIFNEDVDKKGTSSTLSLHSSSGNIADVRLIEDRVGLILKIKHIFP